LVYVFLAFREFSSLLLPPLQLSSLLVLLTLLPSRADPSDEWRHYVPDYVVNRDKPCSFSCSLEIEMPSGIVDMACSTHTIKWERGTQANTASASFWHDTEPMGKDLVLKM
jgi:hypothetical protein